MINLLSAELSRLLKNKLFYALSVFVAGFAAFEIVMQYVDARQMGTVTSLDSAFFAYVLVVGGCAAVFCSMFIGTEYSDGTIRNKLVVGHHRKHIYLCAYVTSVCASVVMTAIWILIHFSLGWLLLGAPALGAVQILTFIGIGITTMLAFNAIFVFIALLLPNRASAAVACLLVFFGFVIVAAVINAMLDTPQFTQDYILTANGVELTEPMPNQRYLSGMKREVYQFIYDVLPTGQALQLVIGAVIHPLRLALSSLIIAAGMTLGGIRIFQREDIK